MKQDYFMDILFGCINECSALDLEDLTLDYRCAELHIKISDGTEFTLQCRQSQSG